MKLYKTLTVLFLMMFSVVSFAEEGSTVPSVSSSYSSDALVSSLEAKEIAGEAPGILITLTLENKGQSTSKVNLDKAITVDRILTKNTKIKSLEKFKPNLYEDLGIGEKAVNHKLNVVYLAPGTKKEVSYFVQTFTKGLFYITFVSEHKDKSLPDENGKDLPLAFYANKIIYIPDANHK